MTPKHTLELDFYDTGFCRIFFTIKINETFVRYCLQDEGPKFGVEFYQCTDDGEPISPTKPKVMIAFELLKPEFKDELELYNNCKFYIMEHPLMMLKEGL